ncbi:MAG: MotB family protein [Pseudomonadota bacterium]
MSDDDEAEAGSPPWMATFADLMSLLMCFFVLLLSFSEMDVEKFKQVAGSMARAFGVQNQFELDGIVRGTSVVATEFSPGKTTESPEETIQQVTDQTIDDTLEVTRSEVSDAEIEKLLKDRVKTLLAETEAEADKLKQQFEDEINTGKIDVESDGRTIVVRIREQGSFPSGSATLAAEFIPVIDRIREALVNISGTVSIEGHTDNVPLQGGRFQSNWGLSANRALSVAHELIGAGVLDESRLMVAGFADSRPFTFNDTPEGRAMNRRVEIVIRQGREESSDDADLEALREINRDSLDMLGVEMSDEGE